VKTAIVILNWNGKKFLSEYLPILLKKTSKELRKKKDGSSVIVVDNGSEDDSVEWMKKTFRTAPAKSMLADGGEDIPPELYIIEFDRNYGFSKGYNKAFEEIHAEYYLLLNSDVRVSEGWLEVLNDYMDLHPDISICMPKILSEFRHREIMDGKLEKEKFEYAGACGGFIDKFGFPFCRGRILSCIEEDEGQYDTPAEIFWASGACLMIRSEVYDSLGGLDEAFFAHMEEIDMCWRAKLAGHKIFVVPQSVVYHVGGGALPNNSPRKLYLNYRNNLLMLYKNIPGEKMLEGKTDKYKALAAERKKRRFITIRKIIDGLSAFVYILQGNWEYARAVYKAHADFEKTKPAVKISEIKNIPQSNMPLPYYGKSIIISFFTGKNKFSVLHFPAIRKSIRNL
jgi:GT2 family glycosyltransferase